MEKIDSREALIEAIQGPDPSPDRPSAFYSEDHYGCFAVWRSVSWLHAPQRQGCHHEDFRLPEDFWTSRNEVLDSIAHIHDPVTHRALANTIITRSNYWLYREVHRFNMQIYEVPDWFRTMQLGGLIKQPLYLHFPHKSLEDPTMMAYTPSQEYGVRDRQVRMKVGKYLTKYYSDVLTPEQIRAFANGEKGHNVKFGESEEDFRYVYRYGPRSCMAGDFENMAGDYMPTDVYATGDFKIAYIEPINQTVVARGIVHEPTKTWVRVYGDEGQSLADWLEANGYTRAGGWPEGALLLKIEDDEGRYVLPYIDGDVRGVKHHGSHWALTSRGCDIYCDFTDGFYDPDEGEPCGDCGDNCDPDDMYYSEYHERSIGPCCIDNYREAIYHRGGYSTWVQYDEAIYCESNGNYYTSDVIGDFDIVLALDGNYYQLDDVVGTRDGEFCRIENTVQVTNAYGDTVYLWEKDAGNDIVFQLDGGGVVNVWLDGDMPDYIEEMYDNDPKIVNDYGVLVGKNFRTMRDLVLSMSADEVRRFGLNNQFIWSVWDITHMQQAYNCIAA